MVDLRTFDCLISNQESSRRYNVMTNPAYNVMTTCQVSLRTLEKKSDQAKIALKRSFKYLNKYNCTKNGLGYYF